MNNQERIALSGEDETRMHEPSEIARHVAAKVRESLRAYPDLRGRRLEVDVEVFNDEPTPVVFKIEVTG